MGDTGSMFLGYMLGTIAMIGKYTEGHHRLAWIAPIIILGIPIFDTLFVMGVRAVRRIPIMGGSPDHFAVRMRNNGVSAGNIALRSYLAAFVLGAAGLMVCLKDMTTAAAIGGGVILTSLAVVIWLWRLGRGTAEATAGTPE